jgi:hypothetical protein
MGRKIYSRTILVRTQDVARRFTPRIPTKMVGLYTPPQSSSTTRALRLHYKLRASPCAECAPDAGHAEKSGLGRAMVGMGRLMPPAADLF